MIIMDDQAYQLCEPHYIRSSNRCRQASREELLRLFQAGESIYYDRTTVHRADFKDIDLDSFKAHGLFALT